MSKERDTNWEYVKDLVKKWNEQEAEEGSTLKEQPEKKLDNTTTEPKKKERVEKSDSLSKRGTKYHLHWLDVLNIILLVVNLAMLILVVCLLQM